jgi:hypothetical protein
MALATLAPCKARTSACRVGDDLFRLETLPLSFFIFIFFFRAPLRTIANEERTLLRGVRLIGFCRASAFVHDLTFYSGAKANERARHQDRRFRRRMP